jgi:hypothetical protein
MLQSIKRVIVTGTLIGEFFIQPGLAATGGQYQMQSFSEVQELIYEVTRRFPGKAIAVFDIDNTVLTSDSDFGTEHWFLWQSELLGNHAAGGGAIAANITQLLKVQGWIYDIGEMRPTEASIPDFIKSLKKSGIKAVALTSRGLDVRSATLRELTRNDMNFASNSFVSNSAGSYLPYDPASPADSGLTPAELERFDLLNPRLVVLEDGVFFTQGQHKGAMLKTLLAKAGISVSAIVFVDDRTKHLDAMQAAFEHDGTRVYTVQMTHESARVANFQRSDKREVLQQWCRFAKGLKDSVFAAIPSAELPFIPCSN